MTRPAPIALASISLLLAACAARHASPAADAESEALAEDGTDTNATESDSESTVTSFLAVASSRVSVASPIGVGPLSGSITPGFYQPAGCLSVTKVDETATAPGYATYTFDRCTGPLGLLEITGVVYLQWRVDSAGLHLDIANATGDTGGPITLNRTTVTKWSAHADVTANGATRTMQWTGSLDGTTPRGRAFHRDNAKTITWAAGDSCVHVDGRSDGQVGARALRTDVTGYERCGACPRAGTITVTNESTGRSIALAFDGGDAATFTAANGVKTEIALGCAP